MYALPLPTDAFELGGHVAYVSVRNAISRGGSTQSSDAESPVTVIRGADGSVSNASVLPRAGLATMQRALAELRKYRKFAKDADARSFDLAEKFIGLIVNCNKPFQASAQIFATGTAVVNLRSFDVVAQFEFIGDGTIVANIDANDEWDADVSGFDGTSIPIEIAQHLGVSGRQ